MHFYGQDCRKAANCRYEIYSQAKNQHFRPARATRYTDSCEIWHSYGARRFDWPCKISRQSVSGDGNSAPKWQTFRLFGKELPRTCEPFDRFLQLLAAFVRNILCISALHFTCFASPVTELLQRNRASVIYPEIFRATCRKNYAFDSKMIDTFQNGLDVLCHHAKFGGNRTTPAGCRCENVVFVTIFAFLSVTLRGRSVLRSRGT